MPLFLCDRCGVIENTALSGYWAREMDLYADTDLNGKALCSQCTPATYADGTPTEWAGKWHGKFKREFPDPNGVEKIGTTNFVYSSRLNFVMNKLRMIATAAALLFVFSIAGAAQDAPQCPVMPSGLICLTREAAEAALQTGDKARALESELTAVKEARDVIRKALDDMRLEYTRAAAEASQLRQDRVADRAIIETLVKYTKKKCMPFSICF